MQVREVDKEQSNGLLLMDIGDGENNSLYLLPKRTDGSQTIYLTESKSAWIVIDWIPVAHLAYCKSNYHRMFDLHPQEKGQVVMFGENVISPRWHRSYLNTPQRDPGAKRSYMYSGTNPFQDMELPPDFQLFLDFINQAEQDFPYNQVIVNWYANGNDFIAAHSDCTVGMRNNASIAIVSLNEDEHAFRELKFTSKKVKAATNDSLFKHIKIAAVHGSIITMHGDIQQKFKHKIPKAESIKTSRISLTFRKIEE